jgi:hypothetical protein
MTRRRRHLGPPTALVLVALAALPRCACDTVPQDAIEECAASQVVPGAVATDILFVIDDSRSMEPFQLRLRTALGRFIQALAASPIANDFRIAVTTTSVEGFTGTLAYPNNAFRTPGTPYPRGIAVAIDPAVVPGDLTTWGDFLWASGTGFYGPRILPAVPADLVADFERNVLVGASGASREQPFAAMRLALEEQLGPGKQNEGFLRPGARLAIVFLSDEDDCSGPMAARMTGDDTCRTEKDAADSTLTPVGDYATFLAGPIGGEVRDVVVAAIVGLDPATLAPSCGDVQCANQACGEAADEGDRFVELVNAVGPSRTRLASICDPNFDAALAGFADAILAKTLPLDGAPADPAMLVARVERPGVGTIPCEIAPDTADATTRAQADAIYEPPQAGRPASLTFQGDCALQQGDRVDVQVVCAG